MKVDGLNCEIFTSYAAIDEDHFAQADIHFYTYYEPLTKNPKLIVYVRKWTDSGRVDYPDLSFLNLTMTEHLYNDEIEKADYFVYV